MFLVWFWFVSLSFLTISLSLSLCLNDLDLNGRKLWMWCAFTWMTRLILNPCDIGPGEWYDG